MEITDIHEAQARLAQLVERAPRGEDVVITRDGAPVVRLAPIQGEPPRRPGGQWKGQVTTTDDFGSLPQDIFL